MIAMRIVAEKQLNMFSTCRVNRFVDDACAAVKDARRPVRLLAMAVARVLCERLPRKTMDVYKVCGLLLNIAPLVLSRSNFSHFFFLSFFFPFYPPPPFFKFT